MPSGHAFAALVANGVCTAAAFTLFFMVLDRIGPTRTGICMAFEAVTGIALAAIFLGESVRPVVAIGGAAVLAGVVSGRARIARTGGSSRAIVVSVDPADWFFATTAPADEIKCAEVYSPNMPNDFTPSTMQDFPLSIAAILRHGERVYSQSECITWTDDRCRGARRSREVGANAARLANALARMGVQNGDRVGTFCWNNQEHLEAYLAVPAMGAVLHTLNIRLFPEQLTYVINHARGQADHRRRLAHSDAGEGRGRAHDGRALHRGRRRRRVGALVGGARRRDQPLRGAHRGRSADLRVARCRRTSGRGRVLHVGHDRQPQGCRVLASFDVPALAHGHDARRAQSVGAREDPHDRPDVPRQRVGHPVRGVHVRRVGGDARSFPAGRAVDDT